MTFERQLPTQDVEHYLQKGSEKAAQTFARAANNTSLLRTVYDVVVKTTDHTLDNLSLDGYAHRNDIYGSSGNTLSESSLRKLMLCAVESVQCLEELEPKLKELDTSDTQELCGKDRHKKLLQAVTVFRTDGQSDIPAMDVEHVIQAYRIQKLDAA